MRKSNLDSLLGDNKQVKVRSGVHYEVDNQSEQVLGKKIGSFIYNIKRERKMRIEFRLIIYKRGD
jgi:hypothetical protein